MKNEHHIGTELFLTSASPRLTMSWNVLKFSMTERLTDGCCNMPRDCKLERPDASNVVDTSEVEVQHQMVIKNQLGSDYRVTDGLISVSSQ